MNNYDRAYEIKDEIIANRRHIHQLAETGLETANTATYVFDKLTEMGYTPIRLTENSVVATVGKDGKTFLLRADMDALPFPEQTGLPFASTNGNMHACGHDTHTAMLMGAARLLKDQEDELKGTVKLMFQPGEENLKGAKEMVAAGVLENPKVDCAMMLHINSTLPEGLYAKLGTMNASSYMFRITINGKGCHGAFPENGMDPTLAAAHVLIGLQEILSREVAFSDGGVLTIGHFEAGSAPNVIPEQAVMEGTLRTFTSDTFYYAQKRIAEVAAQIASAYRCEAVLEELASVPVLTNNDELVTDLLRYMGPLLDGKINMYESTPTTGSEDFAVVAEKVPSCLIRFAAPDPAAEKKYALHNPKMTLNEEVLPTGSAVFAECAMRWLEEHGNLG